MFGSLVHISTIFFDGFGSESCGLTIPAHLSTGAGMAGMARFLPCLLPGVTGHGAMQLCRNVDEISGDPIDPDEIW
jgi:hypothetical protein